SLATSILGTVTAICFYLVVEVLINRLFSQYLSAGEYVCRLSLGHLMVALGFTVAMSIIASAYAAFRVAKIEPSEVIRDV
ncbi:MAG: peptide ABC transporter permease, partial [Proteobacteria bacterium]|nr:peptide ABC transporter permease [Pseudomonadota bacterium]